MKKLIALLPLLLLGACADPAYSPGAWAHYDPTYDWGFSGYDRPYNPGAYQGPYMGPPPVYPGSGYYAPGYSYGPSYSYGCGGCGAGYYGTYYQDPGYYAPY